MKYLLDTDTISFVLRGEERVEERFRRLRPSDVCTSSIVVGEIELGLARRANRKLRRLSDRLFDILTVAPYDREAARLYGTVAASLLDSGTPIGVEDTMVATHALALGLTLVTHNVRHFEQVPRLRVEDWY
jgi:tRNA(fMet)-specific endonuclease VapC